MRPQPLFSDLDIPCTAPACAKCSAPSWIIRLEGIGLGQFRRTFQCKECSHQWSVADESDEEIEAFQANG